MTFTEGRLPVRRDKRPTAKPGDHVEGPSGYRYPILAVGQMRITNRAGQVKTMRRLLLKDRDGQCFPLAAHRLRSGPWTLISRPAKKREHERRAA